MPDTELSLDLSKLDPDYTVVGELGSTSTCRTLIAERKTDDAKRKEDHTGVLISICAAPEDDEANALSHLAADSKTLAAERHRRLVPVLDGRWIDDKHFAVITQRPTDPTINERLASREAFSTIRIAAILRELNGLLEWAREQGIVHRLITGNGVYLEPRTDRVRVMFEVSALHRVRPPEETRDGRTIARLATAMLAGVEDPDTCNAENLQELRPELPKRLALATADLLEVKNASTKTDIVNYIALIGMSDPLYRGEEEEKRIRAEILEEQRAEREKLASERTEFETNISKERADFQALMDREHAKLEEERLGLQKAVADERGKLQKAMEKDRVDLTTQRTELEKAVAAQKAEIERTAALDRKKLEDLRVELKRRGEAEIEHKRQAALEDVADASATELDDEELVAPIFVGPTLVPMKPLKFDEKNPVLSTEPVAFKAAPARTIEPETPGIGERIAANKRWLVPTAVGGGVAVLALIAVLLATHHRAPASQVPAAKRVAAQVPAQTSTGFHSLVPLPPGRVVDSAGGAVAGPDSLTSRPDSAARAVAVARDSSAIRDSIAEVRAARRAAAEREAAREEARQREADQQREQQSQQQPTQQQPAQQQPAQQPVQQPAQRPPTADQRPAPPPRTQTAGDSIFNFRAPTRPRADSVAPRRDSSAARRDSIAPKDTTKP